MSWAKFDDRFPNHPKVLSLSDAAFRMHVSAICYCCDQLTDGFVAACVPDSLPKSPRGKSLRRAIESLEATGLWEKTAGGWLVHDFLDWNPSAAQVLAKRTARAEAGRRGGKAKALAIASKSPSNCQTGCQDTATGSLRPRAKQNSAPSPSPDRIQPVAADPKDLTGSARARDHARGSGSSSGDSIRPQNLDECLAVPVNERAREVLRDPLLWTFWEPHRWPEVMAVAEALARATGERKPRLGAQRDRGVEALVALYADGWSQAELVRAVAVVASSEWWHNGRRGLSSLTPEVVRRALADEPPPDDEASPALKKALAAAQQSLNEKATPGHGKLY